MKSDNWWRVVTGGKWRGFESGCVGEWRSVLVSGGDWWRVVVEM